MKFIYLLLINTQNMNYLIRVSNDIEKLEFSHLAIIY